MTLFLISLNKYSDFYISISKMILAKRY